MLNKNANCYNIEKNFKYSTVISMFSEHIIIFRTLSIDIWQLKCQQRQMANFVSANSSELSTFSSPSFWGKPLWNQKLLLLTATARRSCSTLVRPFSMLSCFPFFHKLFWNQNKNNVVETVSCFVYLLKKYCTDYMSEHLKYCTQINEYWLNKTACLNIV